MSEHTPGEWRVKESTRHKGASVWSDGMQICETGYAEFDTANARLIAAAPDLLEACKAVYQSMQSRSQEDSRLGRKLASAIKKAEGEQ